MNCSNCFTKRSGFVSVRLLIVVAIAAAVGVAIWLTTRPKPAALLTQGLAKINRDPVAAAALFRRALADSHDAFPDAQLGLCLALARQEKWNEAHEYFSQLELADCRSRILIDFGRAASEANQIEAARQALEEVAQRKAPESEGALDLLMAGYRRWGMQHELLAAARDLTRMSPQRFDVWATEVEALRAMKLENECLDVAREALQHEPPDEYRGEFQYLVVEMLVNRGDPAPARDELKKLEALEGETFRVRASAASIARLEGKFDEALKIAGSLFDDPNRAPTAAMIRGFVYLDRGDFAKAVADLKQTVAAQPYNTQAHFKLSEAYRALGNSAEALSHSTRANELSTKRLEINTLLKQRSQQGDPDRSIAGKLAQLFAEIGDSGAATHWHREAGRE